jgi:hypothetical protein
MRKGKESWEERKKEEGVKRKERKKEIKRRPIDILPKVM